MLHRVKGVRQEVAAFVATDAILFGQGTAIKLPAVRILVAGAAIVRTATRMALGKCTFRLMALRARQFMMRRSQCKDRMLVVFGGHHQSRIIEVLVLKPMAEHTTRVGRQPGRLRIA